MMNWSIRAAHGGDRERLAAIGAATFLETFAGVLDGDAIIAHCHKEHSAAAYRAYLAAGCRAWLAEVEPGRAPVGFALMGAANLPGAGTGDVELKRIYTLSRVHGRGIGAALMTVAVEGARAVAAERLLLGVYAGNSRARTFYAKHGFLQIGERTFQVGDRFYDDVVLAKALGPGD